MFAVVVLDYMAEIAEKVFQDAELKKEALTLKDELQKGIHEYGITTHPEFGEIYAYETDGSGNYTLMDDANVPSLLSMPYIGYTEASDPLYQNTRKYILSSHNPYFYEGERVSGVGSPHTPEGYIWPIGLIMQALTSADREEQEMIVTTLMNTDGGTELMHEGFNCNNPHEFTREWFAWANALFSELIINMYVNT